MALGAVETMRFCMIGVKKKYFQLDLWGSVRFAATEEGNVLLYTENAISGVN